MILYISALMAILGFLFVYLSWKSSGEDAVCSKWTGWVLVFSATSLLCVSQGIEFGMSYALFGLAIIPLALSVSNASIRKSTTPAQPRHTRSSVSAKQKTGLEGLQKLSSHFGHFIIVVPICFSFSLLLALLSIHLTHAAEVNHLTIMVVSLPIVWALTAFAYLYSQQRKRFGLTISVLTLALSGIALS